MNRFALVVALLVLAPLLSGQEAPQPMFSFGVIADVDVTEIMLRYFLKSVTANRVFKVRPRVVVGVPSGITELERRAVRSSAHAAGAKEVYMVSEPMAAAIGVGLWCALIVGSVDNFLRPRLVGKQAQLPNLLVLLGTLGGLFFFGPVGVILGPVVAALFVTVWQLYAASLEDETSPAGLEEAWPG